LANVRFADGESCPYCRHCKIYTFSDGKRYRCAKCRQDFSIKTGTIFESSRLPLRKWFIAIYLLTNTGKGISSIQLAKHLGVTQKTAWFMAHRIREGNQQPKHKLTGTVEADETYIGGKAKNMHAKRRRRVITGTGTSNKIPIFGIKTRDGKVRAKVINQVDASTLHRAVLVNVQKGATLYTDEHRGYNGLGNNYRRGVVQHGIGEYVKGDCHTNGIESFWSLFKRGYHGVYHYMSKKHLQRYVNESVFRFNLRFENMDAVFQTAIKHLVSTPQLSYERLTNYEPPQ
jgi:transposase-like protein